MRYEISGRAIVGSKEPQQDAWCIINARGENLTNQASSGGISVEDGTLIVIADGIGGYSGGEIASRLACDAFSKAFVAAKGNVNERLEVGLNAANNAIAEEKGRNPNLGDMGCTLIAIHLGKGEIAFVSIGDSLLLRARDEEIHRVNLDHSYSEFLDRQVLGSDDPERWSVAVRDARRRASLTLALTGGELASAEFGHSPQVAVRRVLSGDVLIAATDGIETLDYVQLQNFTRQLRPQGVEGIANGLIKAVNGIGKTRTYQDNTTIIVIGVPDGSTPTRIRMPAETTPVSPAWRVPQIPKTGVMVAAIMVLAIVALAAAAIAKFGLNRAPGPAAFSRSETKPDSDNRAASPAEPQAVRPQSGGAVPERFPPPADDTASPPRSSTAGSPDLGRADTESRQFADSRPDFYQLPGQAFQNAILATTIRADDAEKCNSECRRRPDCAGYTFRSGRRSCDIFSRIADWKDPYAPEPGAESGFKIRPVQRQQSGTESGFGRR